ncbi:MAG: hypothetical protein GTN81_13890 [Proteobacteria bacterium]|nr:hypothetical protein [Pseudomonadota bacterium]
MVFSVFLGEGLAYGCTCMPPRSVEEAYGKSFAVLIGRVTKIRRPFLDRLGIKKTYGHRVEFQIKKRWKGPKSKTITATTRLSGEACGYPFEVNKDYLVYLVHEPEDIQTGICTGTKDVASAEAEIEQLDRLRASRAQ